MPDPLAKHLEVLADALATPGEGIDDDGLHHVFYDDDENWSLCGRDLSGHPVRDRRFADALCIVCAEREAALAHHRFVGRGSVPR